MLRDKAMLSPSSYPLRSLTTLIRQARQGVARRRVDELAKLAGLTDKDMARILAMSVRSLHGKAPADLLAPAAGERLLLLERLIQHGLVVFDGRADLLSSWLRTPLAELAYRDGADLAAPVSVRSLGGFDEPVTTLPQLNNDAVPAIRQSPLAVLDMVSGFSLADDVLGRIEWGIAG